MKKYKSLLCTMIVVGILGLTACGSDEDVPKLTGQEAIDTFANSTTVKLTGDVDDINTYSDVIADGYNVGKLKEGGIVFNNRVTYSVDGEEQFYIKFCDYDDEDKVVETEDYVTGTTYTYYDMDDNRLGYAQDRVLFEGEDQWYVMVFLDAEGNMKNYYIEDNDSWGNDWATAGCNVYNMDSKQVGSIGLELTSSLTKNFAVDMDLGDAAEELSTMDRVAIYWRSITEMNNTYGDTDDE